MARRVRGERHSQPRADPASARADAPEGRDFREEPVFIRTEFPLTPDISAIAERRDIKAKAAASSFSVISGSRREAAAQALLNRRRITSSLTRRWERSDPPKKCPITRSTPAVASCRRFRGRISHRRSHPVWPPPCARSLGVKGVFPDFFRAIERPRLAINRKTGPSRRRLRSSRKFGEYQRRYARKAVKTSS